MKIDTSSQSWKAVEAHLRQRIADLTNSLISEQPEDVTRRSRAQIAENMLLLRLPESLNQEAFDYPSPL